MASLSLSPQVRARGVTAVLGPTNTGKTHLAIERMTAHSSGLIGLPLRLLAREVYNRVVEKVGPESVALVTGEEKIKPANPRYWVATAEAMPRDLDVAFVAIDEIQLAGDFDRGHVFTDHLLNRRGREETLVIGSATMKPLVESLLPGANIVSRPRLSKLSFAGEKKLTRLPPRTAIVAFSADEVYSIAELIRRQRGGAAVVMGALSPRTRNAQVELFQSGDVDHIIATDAIGMGLNLDIAHVAFAGDSKFDGHMHRRLTTAEFGQIAGRAGRHLKDGTFGTTGRCRPFDPQLIEDLESHHFDPVRMIHWRSPDLDLSSADALRQSLAVSPNEDGLARAPRAEDEIVFDLAAADAEIRRQVQSRDGVTRLWEVCALPDYRKVAPHAHAELVGQIFGFMQDKGAIPEDWFQRQVNLCDRIDGDIDTLSARIAQIRTWTFCANRDWLEHPLHWQGATRAIEDKLSDALHEKLTARFVDRRTSVLMRRLRENAMLDTQVSETGEVMVEGQALGRLQGFRFTPEAGVSGAEAKAMSAAAMKALASEIETRAGKLAAAPDEAFALALDGAIRWLGEPVAKLQAGEKVLEPRFLILADEQLTGGARDGVEQRLSLWVRAHVQKLLGPLLTLEAGEGLDGIGRGVAYQIAEHLGVLDRAVVQNDVKSLDQNARAALRKLGVRFGAYHLTVPALLKPAPRALAAQLWALKHGGAEVKGLDDLAHLAASGRTSIPVDETIPRPLYRAAGFRVCGPRALRVDILERLADLIRPAIAFKPGQTPGTPPPGAFLGDGFTVTGAMTSLAGCSGEDFAAVLKGLGYRSEKRPPMRDVPIVPLVVSAAAPASAAASEAAVDDAAVDAATVDAALAEIPAAEESVAEAMPAEPAVVEEATPEARIEAAAEPTPVEAATAEAPDAAAETPPASEGSAAEQAPVEHTADEQTAAEPSEAAVSTELAAAPPPAAEPELVEVWRPARFDRSQGQQRGRARDGDRQGERHGERSGDRQGPRRPFRRPERPAAAAGESPVEGAPPPQPDRPQAHGGRKPWQKRDRPPEGGERRFEGRRDERKPEGGERRGDRRGNGDRDERRADRGDGRRPERSGERKPMTFSTERPRDKQPDPNSPFAQLAALKAQLEAKK
jgi:ATP-dependent RNA helicase SUPV3L1/SUV3